MSSFAVAKPAKRMRCKTKVATPTPIRATDPPASAQDGDNEAHRAVYLVTFSHPQSERSACGVPLVARGSETKPLMMHALLACFQCPMYRDTRAAARLGGIPLTKVGLWRGYHQLDENGDAHAHDHATVLAEKQFGFLSVKRVLLHRYGLASHGSCPHNGYWSAVRYCCVPSPTKPLASLDVSPQLWPLTGPDPHLPPYQCCHEPITANALSKRSQLKQLRAAGAGEAARITELDVWPVVVANGFRNGADDESARLRLIAHAKRHCSAAIPAYLFKSRAKLPSLIEPIWLWESVDDIVADASRPRLEALHVAAQQPCICNGAWPTAVVIAFLANGINIKSLCGDVRLALSQGRCGTTPVMVMAGGFVGEGKSLFFKVLFAVFGTDYVFDCPEPGNFPLMDLPATKVVFLDGCRFDEATFPYATQCRWHDGSHVTIQRPQNDPGAKGHFTYRGVAPIFATT